MTRVPQAPHTETRASGRAFGWSALGAVASAFTQLIVVAVLARALPPSSFGAVAGLMVSLRVVQAVARLGFGGALVQHAHVDARAEATAFWFLTGVATVAAVVVATLARPVASLAGVDEAAALMPWLAAWLPAMALGVVSRTRLERELRFDLLAPIQLTAYGVGFALPGVTLALLGHGTWALVAAHLGEAVVGSVLLLLVRRPPLTSGVSWRGLRAILREGLPLMTTRLSSVLALQADHIVVGRVLGAEALGLYHRAGRLVEAPQSLLRRAAKAPLRATLAARRREGASLADGMHGSIVVVAALTLPLAAFGALHAEDVVVVALGPSWRDAAPALQLMWLWLLLRGEQTVCGAVLEVQGRGLGVAWRTAVFALAVVVCGALGAARFGLAGAAAGVLVAHVLRVSLLVPAAAHAAGLSGWRWLSAHAIGAALALAVATSSVVVARLLVDASPWVRLPLSLLAALGGGAAVTYALRRRLGLDVAWARLLSRRPGETNGSGA